VGTWNTRPGSKPGSQWGLLARNPSEHVKPPRVDQRAATIWDEEQVRLFFAEAERSSWCYRLYLFLMLTGVRPGEALASISIAPELTNISCS